MKKIFFCFLAFLLILVENTSFAFSEKDLPTEKEYLELIQEGVLDRTISFKQFYDFQKDSILAEKELEKEAKELESIPITRSASGGYKLQAGDIFVTNGYRSKDIIGHAGIVISSKKILSINGVGTNPSLMTLNDWVDEYVNKKGQWINVYRYKYSSDALKAAKWAIANYVTKNSKATYFITANYESTNPTYCSKIVWQAYRYGIPKKDIIYPTVRSSTGVTRYIPISPLRLSHYINPTKLVKQFKK